MTENGYKCLFIREFDRNFYKPILNFQIVHNPLNLSANMERNQLNNTLLKTKANGT